jgi:DNA-binding CsgD family transcriptional regulator
MATTHCFIQLFSSDEFDKQEIELFASELWTVESEVHLIDRIHELFTQIRPHAKTLKLYLQVQVANTVEATFILNKRFARKSALSNIERLTERELQVIQLIAQGLTNREIALKLYISIETVRSHRKHLLLKTRSKNTALLIKYYDNYLLNNR